MTFCWAYLTQNTNSATVSMKYYIIYERSWTSQKDVARCEQTGFFFFFSVLRFTNLQYVQFVESQTSLVSPRQLWDGQQMETFSDYDEWITESAKLDTKVCNQKSEIS